MGLTHKGLTYSALSVEEGQKVIIMPCWVGSSVEFNLRVSLLTLPVVSSMIFDKADVSSAAARVEENVPNHSHTQHFHGSLTKLLTSQLFPLKLAESVPLYHLWPVLHQVPIHHFLSIKPFLPIIRMSKVNVSVLEHAFNNRAHHKHVVQ